MKLHYIINLARIARLAKKDDNAFDYALSRVENKNIDNNWKFVSFIKEEMKNA